MPSTYIDQLVAKADEKARAEVSSYLPEKPDTTDKLKTALEERPALQAHLAWKTGYTPSKWLVEHELEEIKLRREKAHVSAEVDPNGDAYTRAAASGLMGICFSGGCIRRATFNL